MNDAAPADQRMQQLSLARLLNIKIKLIPFLKLSTFRVLKMGKNL
jgi:hypothetical protein